MNYSICPPEQRDVDVSLEDMTAFHAPVFKNQAKNILSETEDLNPNASNKSFKEKHSQFKESVISDNSNTTDHKDDIIVKKEERKYLKEIKFNLGEPDTSDSNAILTHSILSDGDSEEESELKIKFVDNQEYSKQKLTQEETK